MKHEKRQARMMINDILEEHCEPCTKRAETGIPVHLFNSQYCSIHCSAGRDLKKLGKVLDVKTNKGELEVVEVKMEPTKPNYEKLKAEGTADTKIEKIFDLKPWDLRKLKMEWGMVFKNGRPKVGEVPKKETKVEKVQKPSAKEVAAAVETPDYTQELEKYQLEIEGLKYSNKLLTDQLKEKSNIEAYNRETYEELTIARETLKEKGKVITGLFAEFRALEKKYGSLVSYTKEIM